MSYDAAVIYSACEHCGSPGRSIKIGSETSNVGEMLQFAMPGPFEGGGRYGGIDESSPRGGLTGLSGLRCSVAAEHLRVGIAIMIGRRSECEARAPENGWGGYCSALDYLRRCLAACEAHPTGTFAVSW